MSPRDSARARPQFDDGAAAFRFGSRQEHGGHARRTSGSYYTPEALVRVLLDRALDPVVESTSRPIQTGHRAHCFGSRSWTLRAAADTSCSPPHAAGNGRRTARVARIRRQPSTTRLSARSYSNAFGVDLNRSPSSSARSVSGWKRPIRVDRYPLSTLTSS